MDKDILQKYFFLGFLLATSLLMFFLFLPFLTVIALSIILSIVLNPIYEKIKKYLGGRGGTASFLVVLVFIVVIMIPAILFTTKIINESTDLFGKITDSSSSSYVQKITNSIERPIQALYPGFNIDIDGYIKAGSQFIVNHLTTILSKVFDIVTGIVFIFFSLFFFLKDGERFKKILIAFSPLKDKYDEQIFDKLKQSVLSTVRGVLLIATIQGLIAGIGMTIFGLPNPALWGTLTAVVSLVPAIGTALVFIPSVLFMYISGNTPAAVGLFIWWVFAVSLIDNFLGPYLYSRGSEIHPLIMLFAVLGGLAFFGPIGFIFGPVSVALFFSLVEIYQDIILKKSSL